MRAQGCLKGCTREKCSFKDTSCREETNLCHLILSRLPKLTAGLQVHLCKKRRHLDGKYNWKTPAFGDASWVTRGAHATMQQLFLHPDTREWTKWSFLMFGSKPTFTSSCLKLLLNSCNTVSKETVRGSMKFSNSSSSSPIGKTKGSPGCNARAIVCSRLRSEGPRTARAQECAGRRKGVAGVHVQAALRALAHWIFRCFAFSFCTIWKSEITHQPFFFPGSLLDPRLVPRASLPFSSEGPQSFPSAPGQSRSKPRRGGPFLSLLFGCQGPRGLTDSGALIALLYYSLLFMFFWLICSIDGRATFICQTDWGPS